MNVSSFLNVDNMRIEIAVLQEDIPAFEPADAAFRVPALMTENTVAYMSTSNTNIINRSNGNIGSSTVNIDNVLSFFVPFEYTFSYGVSTIPKGTRFLLAFVGANVNDARIIGRYDQSSSNIAQAIATWMIDVIGLEDREKIIIDYCNDNKRLLDEYNDKIQEIKDIVDNNNDSINDKIDEYKSDSDRTINRFKENLEALVHDTRISIENVIGTDKQELNNRISTLSSSVETQINSIRSTLDETVESINNTVNNNISEIREEFVQDLTQARADINNMVNSLREVVEALEARMGETGTNYDNELLSLRNAIQDRIDADKDIIDLITSTKEFLMDEDKTLKKNINTKIDLTIEDYKSADETINSNISSLSDALNRLKDAHEALDILVEEMNERLVKNIADSKDEAIQSANEYTDQKISEEEQSVNERFIKLNEELRENIKGVDNKITKLLYGTFTDTIQEYISTQIQGSNLYTDEEIIKAKKELTEYIDSCIEIVNGNITALSEVVEKNKQDLEDLISDRETAINERIDNEVESLLNTITDTKTEVNNRVDQLLSEMGETIAAQISTVLSNIDESCNSVSDMLTTSIDRHVTRLESNIDELRNESINSVDNTREFLLNQVENTQTALDTKLELLKLRLEQTLATYQDKTDATIKDLKKTLNDHEKRTVVLEGWHDDFKTYYPSDTFETVQDDIDTAQRTADSAYRLAVNGYCSCG